MAASSPARPSARTVLRRVAMALSTAAVLGLAGCAAPSPSNGDAAPMETAADTASIPAAADASATGTPTAATVQIDRSCSTDAECTVKNVGNCCGYYPACVNVDSPTDPEGVKAQCAKSGMASVCGFPSITQCQCVAGQCECSSRALLE